MATKYAPAAAARARPGERPYELRFADGIVLRVQPTGSKTLYVQLGRGKRVRLGPAGTVTPAAAIARAKAMGLEALENGVAAAMPLPAITLGKFLEEHYGPHVLHEHRRGQRTVDDLRRNFKAMLETRLDKIAVSDLDAHVRRRRQDGASAATITRGLNQLQGALRFAVERKHLRATPFANWKAPAVPTGNVVRYMTPLEEAALLKAMAAREARLIKERESANKWRRERKYPELPAVADHVAPMLVLLLNTAARYGEVATLNWSAIDLSSRTMIVEGAKSKSGRGRVLPLNEGAVATLRKWQTMTNRKSGLVFPGPDGKPVASLKTAWATLKKLAAKDAPSISDLRIHDLRHHAASMIVQRGGSLHVVQSLLGHSTLALTQRYAHLAPTAAYEAVALLDAPRKTRTKRTKA
jgi:site-specific recombinase XerD